MDDGYDILWYDIIISCHVISCHIIWCNLMHHDVTYPVGKCVSSPEGFVEQDMDWEVVGSQLCCAHVNSQQGILSFQQTCVASWRLNPAHAS
jgi:hypothetical protein